MSKRSSELYIVDIFLASFLIDLYTEDIEDGDEIVQYLTNLKSDFTKQ